jgi:hypothetical protein
VLGGDHDGVQPHRGQAVVLNRHLRLAVRTQVGQHAALAHLGQPARETMGQCDRQRHQLRCVVDRIAEHQALIARALRVQRVRGALHSRLVGAVHTLGDVRRLRADRDVHTARVPVEAFGRRVIADLEDPFTHDRRDVDIGRRGDLTGDMDLTGRDERLHRHP